MIYTGTFFERGIQPHTINCLYRRKLLLENQIQVDNRISIFEDAACLYPTLLSANKVAIIQDCLYHYQMRENSLMGLNDGEELERYKVLYQYLRKRLLENEKMKEILVSQLDYFMIYALLLKEIGVLQNDKYHLFPYSKVCANRKIVIYGAGRFGCELMKYLNENTQYKVVLWVDNNVRENVYPVSEIENVEYDYIVIAVLIKDISAKIVQSLLDKGIERKKIAEIDESIIEKQTNLLASILA